MDIPISPACLHRTQAGHMMYVPSPQLTQGVGEWADYRRKCRAANPPEKPIAPRVIKLCARCQKNEVKRNGDHCVECRDDHFAEYQTEYRRLRRLAKHPKQTSVAKRKRRGNGECAKCRLPRVKHSAYCLEHRREHDRNANRRRRAKAAMTTMNITPNCPANVTTADAKRQIRVALRKVKTKLRAAHRVGDVENFHAYQVQESDLQRQLDELQSKRGERA